MTFFKQGSEVKLNRAGRRLAARLKVEAKEKDLKRRLLEAQVNLMTARVGQAEAELHRLVALRTELEEQLKELT
jgi:hypothetical protein